MCKRNSLPHHLFGHPLQAATLLSSCPSHLLPAKTIRRVMDEAIILMGLMGALLPESVEFRIRSITMVPMDLPRQRTTLTQIKSQQIEGSIDVEDVGNQR
jgi:hypothetical protein